MKKTALTLICSLPLLFTACTYVQKTGMKETKWLRNTVASDLIYIDGNVKAYRSGPSYYYFRDGRLAKVAPSLVTADKVP